MLRIKVNGEEYILEFGFKAAMEQDVVQTMFDILLGADVLKSAAIDGNEISGMLNGTAKVIGVIPSLTTKAFYAGLLSHHEGIDRAEAENIMVAYMEQENLSFRTLYNKIRDCMADDGFFEKSGLTEAITEMTEAMTEDDEPQTETPKKTTSTKQQTLES